MKMNNNCENCGATVSDDFARVMGDNKNNVHHCFECIDNGAEKQIIRRGGAAYENLEVAKARLER